MLDARDAAATAGAQKGHVRAMVNVAALLERGEGVAKDLRGSLAWYQKALAAGDQKAAEACKRIERLLSMQDSASSSSAPAMYQ